MPIISGYLTSIFSLHFEFKISLLLLDYRILFKLIFCLRHLSDFGDFDDFKPNKTGAFFEAELLLHSRLEEKK